MPFCGIGGICNRGIFCSAIEFSDHLADARDSLGAGGDKRLSV